MAKIIQLRKGRATDIEREAIALLWIQGYGYEEIGRAQGRNPEYIKRIIHTDLGRAEPGYPPELLAEAKSLYEERRMTQDQVAAELGFPRGSSAYVLRMAGARMRRVGWQQKTDAKFLRLQKRLASEG